MNCTKSVTMTVVGGAACDSVPNETTPATLVIPQTVDYGQVTVTGTNNTTFDQNFWAAATPVQVGRYHVDYVSGVASLINPVSGECHSGPLSGILTGYTLGSTRVFLPIGFGAGNINNTINGASVFNCGSSPTGSPSALATATLALNPVGDFFIASGSGGTGTLGQLGGLTPLGISMGTDGTAPIEHWSGGSVTWSLTQIEHVFPQPTRVRIKDYATVKTTFPVCATILTPDEWGNPSPSVAFEWDGTFPYGLLIYPPSNVDGMIEYNATNIYDPGFFNYDECLLMLNGKALATTLNYETRIEYRVVSGVGFWELAIIGYGGGYIQNIWYGKKFTGSTAEGLYSISLADSCVTGPDSICVEAYV